MREGEVLEGRYRIGRLLGSGAMGTVFAASHILLDQKVAIKFLVPSCLGHSDSVARFVREARATATLKSKHVVRVLDVALRDGGSPYIVMEYLEGCDVSAWLRAHGPPEVHVAVDFVLQACDAIAEAHELGIIHRDLKPANLFAVQRGGVIETIKVLDFGISKAAGLVSSTAPPGEWRPGAIITEERVPIGSPCYMSPEQMESARDVDHRTDIWALGVTLCELVTGHLPFEGESLVQIYALIKSGARLQLPEDVPPGLEAVIRKCLEPERDRRYASVRELQATLAPFGLPPTATPMEKTLRSARGYEMDATDSPRRATPSPRAVDLRGARASLSSEDPVTAPKRGGPRTTTMALVGFGALIAVGGVVGLVSKGQSPREVLAYRSASPALSMSASAPPNTSWPASDAEGRAAPGDPPSSIAKASGRETNGEPSSRSPNRSPPVGSAPGDVVKGTVATTPPVPLAPRTPYARALTGNALALTTHDPAHLGDSAPSTPVPSSTAAPSTSSPEEWFPPPVPK